MTRARRSRSVWLAVSVSMATALALVAALRIGVNGEIFAQARRHHLVLRIGSVRMGWLSLRLRDVEVEPEEVSGASVRIADLRVHFGLTGDFDAVEIHDFKALLQGDPSELQAKLAHWYRGAAPGKAVPAPGRKTICVAFDGGTLHWDDGAASGRHLEMEGLGGVWGTSGLSATATDARAQFGSISASVWRATGKVNRVGELTTARATKIVVDLACLGEGEQARTASTQQTAPESEISPLSFPDLHAIWGQARALVPAVARGIRERADVGTDALTWRISHRGDAVALTIGPGPASLTRSKSDIALRFSTDSRISTSPMEVGAVFALDGGGDALTVQGGPISLAQLGLEEGAAGLVDVAHATVTGRARVGLADEAGAITFDAQAAARGVSLYNPRLAPEALRGIDLSLRARGVATAAGELRLDDFAAEFGAVRMSIEGVLKQHADGIEGTFHFDLPNANCESLLESIPGALLPALSGTTMLGTFGARGRFAFDTRALDDLDLDYGVRDHCKMADVPPQLARERFLQPFDHPVYLPDGSVENETTGPGSRNWTPLDEISPYVQVAVMTTEDGAFRKHHGFNRASIRGSIIANLKARRFVRGASTITMQLAKNLFLSRDKTLARKLEEVVLTDYIEQTFSKDEIMDLYLNVIEFGPGVYGITAASEYYFGRPPAELNLAESLFLASLLPSPLRYGAMRDTGVVPDSLMRTLHALMLIAHRSKRITDEELAEGEKQTVIFWRGGERPPPRPPVPSRRGFYGDTDDVATTPVGDLLTSP